MGSLTRHITQLFSKLKGAFLPLLSSKKPVTAGAGARAGQAAAPFKAPSRRSGRANGRVLEQADGRALSPFDWRLKAAMGGDLRKMHTAFRNMDVGLLTDMDRVRPAGQSRMLLTEIKRRIARAAR